MPNMHSPLKKRKHFVKLWKQGNHYCSKHILLQVLPSRRLSLPSGHVGITCSSKVGIAVVRNKIKRRFRSLIALHHNDFLADHSYVFIARVGLNHQPFSSMKAQFLKLLHSVQVSYAA